MSLNYKEIDLILTELQLPGFFIQQIVQPSYDTLGLHLYKAGESKTLVICLAPGACRICETRRSVPKNDKPLRFMEFLRSRIKGSRIAECSQIDNERIIKLTLEHSGETFFMFIRLWSGAANIVVTQSDLSVLDVFYRRPKRNEVTGGTFSLPEPKQPASTSAPAKQLDIREFNFPDVQNADQLTFNEKIDLWYSEHAQSLSREALLEQARKWHHMRRTKMENALIKLQEKRDLFLEAEKWKHQGDLILAYGHLLDGETSILVCTDYDTDEEVRIPVNPAKRAHDNAADYYEKYKKAVSGLGELEHDIASAKNALAVLDTQYERMMNEENPLKIQQLLRHHNTPKQQIEKKYPGLLYNLNEWTVMVGRTSSENDELLRHHVKGQDTWIHTRDWPGGYVFIKNRPGKTIPLDILLDAGNLAVYHSKARRAVTADVYVTQVKNLRRAKNAPKGTVLPSREKNMCIEIDNNRMKKIEEGLII